MMQREKIMAALLASYMGMVVVSTWAEPIKDFFEGKKTVANTWVESDASPATIKIILFLTIVAIVAAKADIAIGRDNAMAPIEILLYSLITGVLIASTVFSYLPENSQNAIMAQTKIVHFLKDYRTLWLLAPIILILVVTSRRRSY
ncbi:MAG: hypothetical protein BWY43_00374 [candidate division WS2 bacterium ADurb.Bin280]|uniref:Uncharacterized protein n=1 Tax=candidate division WS2 bacterium ADurb.Bin280 TaxID=1852829 RepID=A0A1V5SDV4_9BACT|nr:MAG: hypothetical protein BWY43_00374 [candidate division WS2 bacterium ADurb.Bin280]